MRVLQWNAQASQDDVQQVLIDYAKEVDLCIIQEPRRGDIHSDFWIRHASWELYSPPVVNGVGPRVAIFLNKFSKYRLDYRLDVLDDRDGQVIDVRRDRRKGEKCPTSFRIINVYNSHDADRIVDRIDWTTILTDRTIMAGDFNAHSPEWDPECEERRRAGGVEGLIRDFHLRVENRPGQPTRRANVGGQRDSVIDLTLSGNSLKVDDWTVAEDRTDSSDHEIILWTLDSEDDKGILNSLPMQGWLLDRVDPDALADYWRGVPDREWISDPRALDRYADELVSNMVNSLDASTRRKRVCQHSKRWWSEELDYLRELTRGATKRYRRNRTEENRREKREAEKGFQREKRRRKKVVWEEFLKGRSGNEIWQATKYTRTRVPNFTPTLKREDGSLAADVISKRELLIAESFPPQPPDTVEMPELHVAELRIKEEDIRRALWSQGQDKAPGPDGISFRALRILWTYAREHIVALVRDCARLGHHPRTLRGATAVVIRKPGKPDYSKPKAYRAISLISCLSKVVEKVMATAISRRMEAAGAFHKGMCGFRPHRSTMDAISTLVLRTEQAWTEGEHMAMLLVDVKGAFPHVSRSRLAHRMRDTGCLEDNLTSWATSFMSERTVRLKMGGEDITDDIRVETGIPQGSPASPVLFLLYIRELFPALERRFGVVSISFADDITVLIRCGSLREAGHKAADIMDFLKDWARGSDVEFDLAKTELAALTKSRRQIQRVRGVDFSHTVGEPLVFNNEATRVLGVWLDSGLTFRTHWNTMRLKASRAMNRMSSLTRMEGLSLAGCKRVMTACVQAVMLYGAEVWWKGQASFLREGQTLLNQQARHVTGMFRTTPAGALVRESGLRTMESFLDNRTGRAAERTRGTDPTNPAYYIAALAPDNRQDDPSYHARRTEDIDHRWSHHITRVLPEEFRETDFEPQVPLLREDGEFVTTIPVIPADDPDQACVIIERMLRQRTEAGRCMFFSDGSRDETGRVGSAIVHDRGRFQNQRRFKGRRWYMGRNKEVYDAECFAATRALKGAIHQVTNNPGLYTGITIGMDAQAAMGRLRHTRNGKGQVWAMAWHRMVKELNAAEVPVEMIWTPAHIGVEGNEAADKHAKLAAQSEQSRKTRAGPGFNSLAFLRRKMGERKRNFAAESLGRMNMGTHYASTGHFEGCPHMVKKWNNDLKEVEIVALPPLKRMSARMCQFRSGHMLNKSYLRRIGKLEPGGDVSCGFCQSSEPQTRDHLLLRCAATRAAADDHLWPSVGVVGSRRTRNRKKKQWTAKRLLKEVKPEALWKFLEQTPVGRRTGFLSEEMERREERRERREGTTESEAMWGRRDGVYQVDTWDYEDARGC